MNRLLILFVTLATATICDAGTPRLTLSLQSQALTVCQLEAGAPIPAWAASANGFVSITRTGEELSIVCEAGVPPANLKHETGWRAFKIDGPLDFGLTGILASVLDPLAKAGVSIFAISTYNTDYILVKEDRVAEAIQALERAGHTVRRK